MIRFLVSNHLGLFIRACTYRRPIVRSIAVAVDINGIPRMFFVAMWPPLRFESFTSYGTPVNFYSQMAADLPLGDHTKIVTTYIPVSSTHYIKIVMLTHGKCPFGALSVVSGADRDLKRLNVIISKFHTGLLPHDR